MKTGLLTLFLIFFLLITSMVPVFSQSIAIPQEFIIEEAPPTLFELDPESEDLDLFLTGSYKGIFSGGAGFGWEGTEFQLGGAPSRLASGIAFKQVPDMTLSLWLFQKYFLEFTYLDGYDKNSLLFGYSGEEQDFLRFAIAGQGNIPFPGYRYITSGQSQDYVFGGAAVFESLTARHDAAVRFEPSLSSKKSFLGMNEVEEITIQLGDYVKGRFFHLPDSDIDSITIYIEDFSGSFRGSDGRSYKQAGAEEISAFPQEGKISFPSIIKGRVLVFYEKNGLPVGSPGLGTDALPGITAGGPDHLADAVDFSWTVSDYNGFDMADRKVVIDGSKECLLLHDPVLWNPFELTGIYTVPSSIPEEMWQSEVKLALKGSNGGITTPINAVFKRNSQLVEIYYPAEKLKSRFNNYPFADNYPGLYDPRSLAPGDFPPEEILLTFLHPVAAFELEKGIIQGSLFVYKNDKEITDFTITPDSGILTLTDPVHENDRIDVFYKTASGTASRGDFVFVQGNTFSPMTGLTIQGAIGGRWNFFSDSFTTRPNESPGMVALSGAVDFQNEVISLRFEGGGSFSTSDTTGTYRFLGMERRSHTIYSTREVTFPAAVPAETVQLGNSTISFSGGTRGVLIYKDYSSYGSFGARLDKTYDWPVPEDQVFPYSNGSLMGPYLVKLASNSPQGMALDYEISQTKNWVGGQIGLREPMNISDSSTLTFNWLYEGNQTDIYPILQIGAIGEDIDNDGILDAESSITGKGFNFNDPTTGYIFKIGADPRDGFNSVLDSEDLDGNGALDKENSDYVVTRVLTPPTKGIITTEKIVFTPEERRKLGHVKGLRLILVRRSSEAVSGRIIISGIQFDSTKGTVYAGGNSTIQVTDIPESQGKNVPTRLLVQAQSAAGAFNKNSTTQPVREIRWEGLPGDENITVSDYITPVNIGDYRYLHFFIRVPELTENNGTLYLNIQSHTGKGLHVTLPVSTTLSEWTKITIDTREKTVLAEGKAVSGALIVLDEGIGTVSRIRISLSGSSGGLVYIDEFYASETQGLLGGGGTLAFQINHNKPVITIGEVPLLANILLKTTSHVTSDHFIFGNSVIGSEASFDTAASLGMELLFFNLQGNFETTWTPGGWIFFGGHGMSFPSFGGPLTITDTFRRNHDILNLEMLKTAKVAVLFTETPIFNTFSVNVSNNVSLSDSVLTQLWNGSLGYTFSPFSLSVTAAASNITGYTKLPRSRYLETWLDAWLLGLPVFNKNGSGRSGSANLDIKVESTPLGAALSGMVTYQAVPAEEGTHDNSGTFNLTLPFNSQDAGGLGITFQYAKNISARVTRRGYSTFFSDGTILIDSISKYLPVLLSIPVGELFLPETETLFKSSTTTFSASQYSPQANLTIKRNFGSFIQDIFIPSAFSAGFARSFIQEGTAYKQTAAWNFEFSSSAINLFGDYGAYPTFDFYKSDEITTTIQITLSGEKTPVPANGTMIVRNVLTFIGKDEEKLSIENTLNLDLPGTSGVSDSLGVNFTWKTPDIESDIIPLAEGLPLINEKMLSMSFLEHTESLKWGISSTPGLQDLSLTLQLSHQTSVKMPLLGYLRGHIRTAFESFFPDSSQESPQIIKTGIEGGVELSVRY